MKTYDTGNPLGSTDARDRFDNSQNLDIAVNSSALTWLDRGPSGIHRVRKTWAGIEEDARAAIETSGFAFTSPLDYQAGIVITLPNQIFLKDGEYYRAGPAITLPYATTGDWATEGPLFRSTGDAVIRSNLASESTSLGVSLVYGASRTVDTVADMLALPSDLNPVVYTRGYYSPGDGGGTGPYRLSTSDISSPSNGGTLIVAADGGRYYLDVTVSMDMRAWGSMPTGIAGADATPAIQKAANWCAANGVQLVYTGIRRLLTPLEIPENTEWYGAAGSAIYLDPAMAAGPSIGGSARCIYSSNKKNIRLTGIDFYSGTTGINKAVTICFEGPLGLHIRDCKFRNFGNPTYYAQGLIVFGGSDVHVSLSKFNDNSGDGAAVSFGTTNYSFDKNEFKRNGDWGLALVVGCNQGTVTKNVIENNVSTGTGIDRCEGVVFQGNIIDGNEHGIRVAEFGISTDKNRDFTIIGNVITNSGVAGVSVEGTATPFGMFVVSGNTINGTNGQGIRIVDAEGGTITDNVIYSSAAEGILFLASTTGRITGECFAGGNTIIGCTYGVRQVAPSSGGILGRITIAPNHIAAALIATILAPAADFLDMSPVDFMTISKPLNISTDFSVVTASSGGATLPSAPAGFVPIYVGGVKKLFPYYNA